MSEMKTAPEILEIIKSITANRESARLEINSSGTYGTLLFNEGRLVDARLGSLSGFQAINAAVSLRDVEFSMDHVPPASHSSTITPSERIVLKRFFGIEAAEPEERSDVVEPNPDWNTTPEHVVPLAEVRGFSFSSKAIAAISLALILGLTAGAFALRSKLKVPQQTATVAAAVAPERGSDPQPPIEVKPEAATPKASQPKNTPVRGDSSPPVISTARREANKRDANVQDLTGEWRVINTVEKTAYKTFDKLQVGFRLVINQSGKDFTAKGEKFSENGRTLPAANRTPIRVTGTIDGNKVVASFIEDGRLRKSNGRFVWTLQKGGDGLAGTFVSSAANSSGRSAVTKQN